MRRLVGEPRHRELVPVRPHFRPGEAEYLDGDAEFEQRHAVEGEGDDLAIPENGAFWHDISHIRHFRHLLAAIATRHGVDDVFSRRAQCPPLPPIPPPRRKMSSAPMRRACRWKPTAPTCTTLLRTARPISCCCMRSVRRRPSHGCMFPAPCTCRTGRFPRRRLSAGRPIPCSSSTAPGRTATAPTKRLSSWRAWAGG